MEISKKYIEKKGKELAFLLRHDTEYNFDSHGWREVKDLIKNHGYTKELLDTIVETNNKKRYEYDIHHMRIRARQGHSINVDVELTEIIPPEVLYHGTSVNAINSIKKEGITKMNRLHVHLSKDQETAKTVGSRHGKPIIIQIDTKQMVEDGIKFFISNNDVYLTDYVDYKYCKIIVTP